MKQPITDWRRNLRPLELADSRDAATAAFPARSDCGASPRLCGELLSIGIGQAATPNPPLRGGLQAPALVRYGRSRALSQRLQLRLEGGDLAPPLSASAARAAFGPGRPSWPSPPSRS